MPGLSSIIELFLTNSPVLAGLSIAQGLLGIVVIAVCLYNCTLRMYCGDRGQTMRATVFVRCAGTGVEILGCIIAMCVLAWWRKFIEDATRVDGNTILAICATACEGMFFVGMPLAFAFIINRVVKMTRLICGNRRES